MVNLTKITTNTLEGATEIVKKTAAKAAESVVDSSRKVTDDIIKITSDTQKALFEGSQKIQKDDTIREVKTKFFDKVLGQTKDAVLEIKKTYFGETITLKVDGKNYGHTDLKIIKPGESPYGWSKDMYNYTNKGSVYIENMKSYAPGAGTKLHQAAVLRSQELGNDGRVALGAIWNSHGFHYKSGFRPINTKKISASEKTSLILEAFEQAKITGMPVNTRHVDATGMVLPEENIAALLAK